jgi:hypothetical protein
VKVGGADGRGADEDRAGDGRLGGRRPGDEGGAGPLRSDGREALRRARLAAAPRESDGSKLAAHALPTFPATEVDGLFIEDAYLFLECALDRIADDFGENSLIVGRILAAHVREDYLRASERDDQDLIHGSPLVAYLSPGRYAPVGESYSFPFPAGFMR